MQKNLAINLLPVVNIPSTFDVILAYVDYRREHLRKELETATNPIEIYQLQGQIKEIKRFLTLREEVLQETRNGNNK